MPTHLTEKQLLGVILELALPHLFLNDLLLAPTPKPDRFELGVYPRFGRSDHAKPLYAIDITGWNTAYDETQQDELADAITGLLENLLAGALAPAAKGDTDEQTPADQHPPG